MRVNKILSLFFLFAILLGSLAGTSSAAYAEEGEGRTTTIKVPFTEYEWWLLSWQTNDLVCKIYIDHEGVPTTEDVYNDCGVEMGKLWQSTPPCIRENGEPTSDCKGLYLHLVFYEAKEKELIIQLPEATVWVNIDGCDLTPPENFCPEIPNLLLTGDEPLPNERILDIQGSFDGQPFICPGENCTFPLKATGLNGIQIDFWADSSYGDTSDTYTALVRVVDSGVSNVPGGSGWYVDVLSSQWQGPPIASCAEIWDAFPSIGTPPKWLSTPQRQELLGSWEPYYYLAGRMIAQGLIDASECTSGGLLPNGYADACGLEKSSAKILEWQNQFDQRIIQVSDEKGIPAQLMKNLFAQESQFWPGIFKIPDEYGLGQLTAKGTDSILLWNEDFYNQFCPLVLSEDTCSAGYVHLSPENQSLLRGALALQAKVDCPDCAEGVSLLKTEFSIDLFADTLKANCAQVARTIYTATNNSPGKVSNYEDLWRFTVANYHGGPGCLSYAIHQAWQNDSRLDWDTVKQYFTEPCKGNIPYVETITQ